MTTTELPRTASTRPAGAPSGKTTERPAVLDDRTTDYDHAREMLARAADPTDPS